jgi:septum formation protein
MKLILASQSEIRKRALNLLNFPYEVIPANIDEKAIRDPDPFKQALKLSEAKALEIGKSHHGIIIASDAFLVHQNQILEKPGSSAEAFQMIKSLSGSHYFFLTGLAVYRTDTKKMLSSVESCQIYFRDLEESEINDYISRYPVTKFAGGHETDAVARFADKVIGNYNFFTAVPMNKLIEFLKAHNFSK